MTITLICVLLLAIAAFCFLRQKKFGKAPDAKRIAHYAGSPGFKDGRFHNISVTPQLTEGYTMLGLVYDQLFRRAPRRRPAGEIPSLKTDLFALPADHNVLVWFGHSSYFIQIDGKKILVDPVFSGNASPLAETNKAFKGTDRYTVEDIPPIDYLFITHDHYDHLDYETVRPLTNKVQKVICGLGVEAHLEYWGHPAENIIAKNWGEKIELDEGFIVYCEPARHFSGRAFSRNNTLWVSFLLQTPTMKIYIGGDSGYDAHFADIGNKHGPIDLAILDNGQYDLAWQLIHMLPDEVLRAAKDLRAERLLPVHSSKFVMANHAWDEPLGKISELNASAKIPLVTPMIGEVVDLNDMARPFKEWWKDVR